MGMGNRVQETMSEQPQLFDIRRETVDVCANPRQSVIDSTLEKADEEFKERYLEVLMEFVRSGQEFIGEMVQVAYKCRRLPPPKNWRAVGGIYQRLIRKGVIEVVGYGKRNQGNPSPKYRGK